MDEKTWKKTKPMLSLVPAILFWVASMIFFVVGMSFENPIYLLGKDVSMAIAFGLMVSITLVQVVGNSTEDLDRVERGVWLASYALGIGTNVYGLMLVLNISSEPLKWIICASLGVIIEISPEKLFVRFLKSLASEPKKKINFRPNNNNGGGNRPQPKPNRPSPRPSPSHQSPQPRPDFSARPEPSSAFLEAMESFQQSSEPVHHNIRQQGER